MRSMTGYGTADQPLGEGRIAVEIRSLNHRYLDVRVRMPTELADQAFFVEQFARERLARGRYDVGVRLEGPALPPPSLAPDRVRAAYRELTALRDELAPGTPLGLEVVACRPDLLDSRASLHVDATRKALTRVLEAALADLHAMRSREGSSLEQELRTRLDAAVAHAARIERASSGLVEAQRARLQARIERLLADTAVSLDAGRLEQEIAILADKSDVTEELVRLTSHFEQFRALLDSADSVGRRLDFLLQEMGREVNTIGSKCQDAEVAHEVVHLKAELERVREQVQNVE